MILFWDKDGTPLSTLEWARKYEDYSYRFVGHDQVDDCRISTLWMGVPPTIGLCFHLDGDEIPPAPPVFQTMVFVSEHPIDERNYYSEAEALAGHRELVALAGWYSSGSDGAVMEKEHPCPPPA